MVENPVERLPLPVREPDDPTTEDNIGRIRVRRTLTIPDFDQMVEDTFRIVDTKIVGLDAKIMEGTGRNKKLVHYHSLRHFSSSPTFRKRIREAVKYDEIRQLHAGVTDIVEHGGDFTYGLYPDEATSGSGKKVFPVTDVALPTTSSPQAKQMLFVDYLDMHRKAWEAATRNPIGKRIVRLVPQFVLGRSLLVTVNDARYQAEMDEFWKQNRMKLRIKQVFKELLIYGEIFLRYFRRPEGLVVRSLDPSTIWDIVTNPDDIEDVYFYHQQYVITNNSPIAAVKAGNPPSTLIIRQIPAADIDHYKINSTSSEKRGRSELFAVLGYLQRIKEFVNDRIIINKIRSMFALDVTVEGQQTEVDKAEEQFASPPGTGSVIVHNKSVEIEFKTPDASDAAVSASDAELLLKMVALGANVSESFLGVGAAGTRAGALIQTEPDIKNFEDYQEYVQTILDDMSERIFEDGRKRRDLKARPPKLTVVAAFPSIAQEDRSSKLKDVGFSESMSWFSKRRAANMAADEMKQHDYDYDEEQAEINVELASDPVIASSLAVVKKDPDSAALTASGAAFETTPTDQTGEKEALSNPGGQMRSDPGSRALPNTGTNLRGKGLDRKKEAARIKAGISRESTSEQTPGWSSTARLASIEARRRKAASRRAESDN